MPHARQIKRPPREVRKPKTYVGRVVRDIERKLSGNPTVNTQFVPLVAIGHRLLQQQRTDHNTLYSLHTPEVECIAKGKAHKRYEFGCKVSVVATSKDNFLVGAHAVHDNP